MSSVKQTVSLLHRALLLLLKDSLNFSSRLQVVGAVCITVDDDCNDLVIKFNDILQRDEGNTPINLVQHGSGNGQRPFDVPNGQPSTKLSAAQQLAVGTQSGKRKQGKAPKVVAATRRSGASNEPPESDVEEEDVKPMLADGGATSQSDASSVDDPSYTAGSKKRKASAGGSNTRFSFGTPASANAAQPVKGAGATLAKRRAASNGSSADGKAARPGVGLGNGSGTPAVAEVKSGTRQTAWQAPQTGGSRKRAPCSCQVCGMVFCSRAVLERHALRHFGVRPYECTVCSERFYRKDQALTHVKKTHERCTPAENYVAEKVGKTESRQLIEQLANANAGGVPDQDTDPDTRTPVGVGGLPTFVSACAPSEDADDDPDAVRNEDELDDDEDDAEQRNSPSAPINASSESLSSLIQRKCMRSELRSRGAVGVGVGNRSVRTALAHLANEDEDEEQRARAVAEDEPNDDEDAAILRHQDEDILFGGATMTIDNDDDDDDGDAPVSSVG